MVLFKKLEGDDNDRIETVSVLRRQKYCYNKL